MVDSKEDDEIATSFRVESYNNYLSYKLTGQSDSQLKYEVILKNQGPTYSSGLHEAINCARNLYDKFEKLTLCLSDGLDSQAMLEAFRKAGVPFEVSILQFSDDLNFYDIKLTSERCRALGIKTKHHTLDANEFYRSGEFIEYLQRGVTLHPELAAHLWLVSEIDSGVPIFSGNPPYIQQIENLTSTALPPFDFFCYDRYSQAMSVATVGNFFMYSWQLYKSFINQNLFKSALAYPIKSSQYDFKKQLYRNAGFNVVPQFNKLTGFEYLQYRYFMDNQKSWYEHYRRIAISHVNYPQLSKADFSTPSQGVSWHELITSI